MRSGTAEKQTQDLFDMPSALAFLSTSVNEKVDIFNRTILNIVSNFIPHEITVCNGKDPPWFNNRIKTLIQKKIKKMLHIRFIAITKIILI